MVLAEHGGAVDPTDEEMRRAAEEQAYGNPYNTGYTNTSPHGNPTTPAMTASPGRVPRRDISGSSVPGGMPPHFQPAQQQYVDPIGHAPQMSYQQQTTYVQHEKQQQQQQQQQGGIVVTEGPLDLETSPARSHEIVASKEFPVMLKGSRHFFHPRTKLRWYNPVMYQDPGYKYRDADVVYRHRDFAGHLDYKGRSDRYLHHTDGYLRNLYVACTDEIFEGPGTSTWKRTFIQSVASYKIRIATWVLDFTYDEKDKTHWWVMFGRSLPAALAMTFFFWEMTAAVPRNSLYYAPVLYSYHGCPKVWSNVLENSTGSAPSARNNEVYRLLKPRHLCFLRNPQSEEVCGVDVRNVSEWEDTDGQDTVLRYMFVAYSTKHFDHGSKEDMAALNFIAETACRAAKLPAFWVAGRCMRDEGELESDVFRISDVLRGAQDMIIAVGRGKQADYASNNHTGTLLREWGDRMWTFPEVLLSPGKSIKVYTRGGDLKKPWVVPKNQFATRVWTYIDADISRHLIDHYLGNIDLSRLELAVLALKCLYTRQTTEHFQGDQAYALMGLLRIRPQVDQSDSAFQAFSRLSLANDSDKLLERYICTLPLNPAQSWHNMEDAYMSSLWDITPYCQVAAIENDDSIIIDGAWGASIRWKSFYRVWFSTGPSWKRFFAGKLVEYNGVILVLACVFFAIAPSVRAASTFSFGGSTVTTSSTWAVLVVFGVIFLLLFLYGWYNMPRLIRILYGGKFSEIQAEYFGFEGYLNAPTIERALFGGNFERFTWSTNGSPLSRSVVNEYNETIGVDPYKHDPDVRVKVERAKSAVPGQTRIFTLVDTYNMQLTMFEAVNPPATLMFCAAEGGMQRAVGCSYDWTNQTMYRETVLRMPTVALNKLDRVPRFRLGINREAHPVAFAG